MLIDRSQQVPNIRYNYVGARLKEVTQSTTEIKTVLFPYINIKRAIYNYTNL